MAEVERNGRSAEQGSHESSRGFGRSAESREVEEKTMILSSISSIWRFLSYALHTHWEFFCLCFTHNSIDPGHTVFTRKAASYAISTPRDVYIDEF